MMTALLLYAYCNGAYSSRRIAKASRERVDFMSVVGLDAPDFHTVSDFRKRHLKALAGLFTQVLKLCEQAGLAKLGHVALDGTKIKANASKHKAMSYERMAKRAAELEAEVARWMSAAEALDGREDEAFGRDKSGDEMPDWVADKKKRAEKIRAAQAELEAEAKAAAAAEAKARAEAEEKRKAEGRKKPGRPAAPPSEEPDPKARRPTERPASTGADRRCDRSQSRPQAHAVVGRRRLLLRGQPCGDGAARDRRLYRARAGQTRERGRRRRGAGRRHAREDQGRRPPQCLSAAQANCPSRCSDRSSKRAASASSYCAGSRKSPPNGPSSASPTMF